MYFNKKYNNVGPVFQGRFRAKMIDNESYLLQLSRYIHQNPWELVRKRKDRTTILQNYKWSSYADYVNKPRNKFVKTDEILSYFSKTNKNLDYKSFVEEPLRVEKARDMSNLLIDYN